MTAVAPTALEAETLSKMALPSGAEGARTVLGRHGGVIVHEDGRAEDVGRVRERRVVRLRVSAASNAGTAASRPPDPLDYGWWLASRASALTALLVMTIAVGAGLAMAGKVSRRPGLSRILMAIHEHGALIALVAVAVHGITLMGDRWLHPGLQGIVVPFAMSYRPLFTGIGIIGGYLAALLALSFYIRRRIGARLGAGCTASRSRPTRSPWSTPSARAATAGHCGSGARYS